MAESILLEAATPRVGLLLPPDVLSLRRSLVPSSSCSGAGDFDLLLRSDDFDRCRFDVGDFDRCRFDVGDLERDFLKLRSLLLDLLLALSIDVVDLGRVFWKDALLSADKD
mmetsp:Transcript_117926/g.176168  ORF Transcript_117926/g.176168 Transcript_117926/m.176168 type:complete len:111 (-) Transcript_117926:231-563(-)